MTSRLDRLFVLLEAGAGAATRRAAARQLGEVQRAHPEELHRLLARLTGHLRSPAWETRVAAAQAVEAILSNVPEWKPPPSTVKEEPEVDQDKSMLLRCETFDIERVLQNGELLMGSEGKEYDMDEEAMSATDMKERIAKQRQQLNARLGLEIASTLGVDVTSMYSNEDLCLPKPPPVKEKVRRPIQEIVLPGTKPLSSREMNVAKRRARQALCKQKSRDGEEGPSAPEPKKIKVEVQEEVYCDPDLPTPCPDGSWPPTPTWPLHSWCLLLQSQLFSSAWEARHGAASALRELLRAKVSAAAGARTDKYEEDHQEWLEDMALRLVCVLSLDRFGDFVSDQVVAPVRETSAQTLGVALAQLRASRVRGVARLLTQVSRHPQWEPRHGALLAFKYLLAARQDVACESGALEHLISGLDDAAEDVSAVAAAALVPAAAALALIQESLRHVVARLWELLQEQDELAASANSYMALLAALLALPRAAKVLHPIDLSDVLPRLWPYLDHCTSSVRKATLQTLRTLTRPLVTDDSEPNTKSDTADNATTEQEEPPSESVSNIKGVEYLSWTPELLQEAMRYIYQRVLIEHVHEIQEIALQVWRNLVLHAPLQHTLLAACPLLSRWLCLAMQPAALPLGADLLLLPPTNKAGRPRPSQPAPAPALVVTQKLYLGGSEAQGKCVRERNVTRARCLAADMLGYLSCYLVQPAPGLEYKDEDESPIDCYVKVITVYLQSGSALQRLVAGLVISAWAKHTVKENMFPPKVLSKLTNGQTNGDASDKDGDTSCNGEKEMDISKLAPPLLVNTLHAALNQTLYYDEVAFNCNRILQEARDLLAMMKHYKLPVDSEEFNNIMRLEQVIHMTRATQPMVAAVKLKRVQQSLEERRVKLQADVDQCSLEQAALNVDVQAALACAVSELHNLPTKLNPVVRPLMESIKRGSAELQAAAAATLPVLLDQLPPPPSHKVVCNLKAFLRCDPELTPRVSAAPAGPAAGAAAGAAGGGDSGSGDSGGEERGASEGNFMLDTYTGILTLVEQQRAAERATPRRGRPPAAAPAAPASAPDTPRSDYCDVAKLTQDESQKVLDIQRRGATLALRSLTRHFGARLPDRLPALWGFIHQPLARVVADDELETQDSEAAEELISRLQVIESVCDTLDLAQWPHAAEALATLTRHRFTAVRHMSGRALAAVAAAEAGATAMHATVHQLLPALGDMRQVRARCGAAEALSRIVDSLKLRCVPYIVLLLVPLLGRMSDPCSPVRTMSTRCFASLIQLMPLDGAVPEPEGLSPELQARRANDRKFIEQLFNPKSIKDYKIPVPVAAELRSYQQAGVNWLRFLDTYKLHGVLCDDMGLGKTLQSIVVMASSHYERQRAYQSCVPPPQDQAPLPSLVVCPPTLTGHWVFEVNKFISTKYLKPLQYVGPPIERDRLRSQVGNYNLVVASYDIVRKDIDFFSSIQWNYCVLDEGHIIKNGKTKAFKAIKQLVANHRLILSGTPIQNNVLELWSLFDFLMPGLLGSERQFTARYSRAILSARDPKATQHQMQAAALACEALHRQVLPFLLRRVKEDVLKELPPKITQDYYCELSPLQRRLYEDFSKAHMPKGINSQHAHVFEALHYLQNVCNHPKLVLTADHPEAARVTSHLRASNSTLDDIDHSAKLPALKQLLLECGIGSTSPDNDSVVSQHRALVFCQLKKMLDILENDLLKRHLPSVSYLRIDGSVPPATRHAIVTRFNNDPSIDLLLLTTAVGGLGLNLTGADTVIFVEHDWNPMKDLQAMDRAHRIGQRRVVNVYRLITRDTLEEKIMGLQKFKLMTANTVISSENAAMETMGTDQLLDLFQPAQDSNQGPPASKSVLESLPDLWDDRQYEEEYDMTNFIKGLNKMNE